MSSTDLNTHTPFRAAARTAARPTGRSIVIVAALATALSGCATGPSLLDDAEAFGDLQTAATPPPSRLGQQSAPDAFTPFYRQAAAVAISEGQIYGAVGHLAKVHEADPGDADVAFELARHLRYIGALGDAETVLGNAIGLHPENTDLLLERGKLLVAQGRAGEAEAILTRLAEADPKNPDILLALGVARDRRGDHASAQAAYRQAIDLGAPSAELLNNAALSQLIEGDADAAVSLLRRAAAAPGATAQIRQNLALALTVAGQRDEARRIVEENLPEEIALDTLALYDRLAASDGGQADAWSLAVRGGAGPE